jgi:transposase
MSAAQLAKAYRTNPSTIYRWIARHDASGVDGLERARNPGSGRPRKLDELDGNRLLAIVSKPAAEFGYETDLWTCSRALQVIRKEFRIKVSRHTVWRRLREAGLSYQKPERRYLEASEKERAKWRRITLPKIRAAVRQHKAILYFQDEANVSLTAVLGKTWSPRGKRPTQTVTGKRGGVAAMSAIAKSGRLVFRLLQKRINSDDVIAFLAQMLKHHRRRHLVVVMDRAPPHTSKKTKQFIEAQARLHVFYLPKYSPDWNPDEQVWKHLKNQELKGHQETTKDGMTRLVRRKLQKMGRNSSQLRGIFFRCCIADLLH